MIKIGDFSKISQISVRTLRYYDEIDILKPEFIDPSTGYRYYKAHQLHACHQIKALRSLGMGLNAIKVILDQRENSDIISQYLGEQKASLIKEREAIEQTVESTKSYDSTVCSE